MKLLAEIFTKTLFAFFCGEIKIHSFEGYSKIFAISSLYDNTQGNISPKNMKVK